MHLTRSTMKSLDQSATSPGQPMHTNNLVIFADMGNLSFSLIILLDQFLRSTLILGILLASWPHPLKHLVQILDLCLHSSLPLPLPFLELNLAVPLIPFGLHLATIICLLCGNYNVWLCHDPMALFTMYFASFLFFATIPALSISRDGLLCLTLNACTTRHHPSVIYNSPQ